MKRRRRVKLTPRQNFLVAKRLCRSLERHLASVIADHEATAKRINRLTTPKEREALDIGAVGTWPMDDAIDALFNDLLTYLDGYQKQQARNLMFLKRKTGRR